MITFDMPSREVCTMRRIPTNTPLQALVTLNDEAYVECATGLAERMVAEGGETAAERIAWAYRAATGRTPAASTLDDLMRVCMRQRSSEYESDTEGVEASGGDAGAGGAGRGRQRYPESR